MAVPFSNTKLRVPKGFQNILEGLAREVLRTQPDNIYEFGATYFDTLLRNRTETGHDPAIHGARLEDRTYNNHAFKKGGVDPSDPQQQKAAVQIQTQYRQHSAKQTVEKMKEEEAAVRIQAGFRGYIDRQEIKNRKSGSESSKKDAEEEIDIDLNDPAVEDAAVKIQAQFKGFKARKEIQTKKDSAGEPAPEPYLEEAQEAQKEEVDIDLDDPEVSTAAIKIQSGFRGHLARQEIRQRKEQKAGVASEQGPDSTTAESEPAAEMKTIEEEKESKAEQEEEEVDIDLTDPDVEKAAVKIQAGFRGYKTRRSEKQAEASSAGGGAVEAVKAAAADEGKPESPFPEAAAQYEPKNKKAEEPAKQEEEVDIDLNDPEVEKAAIKIQAGFKGFKARKTLSGKKEEGDEASKEGEEAATSEEVKDEGEGQNQAEEVDIDLNNPEFEHAAVRIQAGYRGFRTRQELKSNKTEETEMAQQDDKEVQGEAEQEDKDVQGETGESTEETTTEGAEESKAEEAASEEQAEQAAEGTAAEGQSEEPKTEQQEETAQETSEAEKAEDQTQTSTQEKEAGETEDDPKGDKEED